MRSLWEELVQSRAFWLSYLCAGIDFAPCKTLQSDLKVSYPMCGANLRFSLPSSYCLILQTEYGEHRLSLFSPEYEEPMRLAWMDCHQMSDLLRWDEFHAIVRAMEGNAGPTWAHQLLLCFYVAVTADCAEQYLDLLQACLTECGLFNEQEMKHICAKSERFAVRQDFRWVHKPKLGWIAEGRDAYSMRSERIGFDFAAFAEFLQCIEQYQPKNAS